MTIGDARSLILDPGGGCSDRENPAAKDGLQRLSDSEIVDVGWAVPTRETLVGTAHPTDRNLKSSRQERFVLWGKHGTSLRSVPRGFDE